MKLSIYRFFASLFLIFSAVAATAQIPQNIEVEGEATGLWDYVLFAAVLLAVGLVIVVILKMIKRK